MLNYTYEFFSKRAEMITTIWGEDNPDVEIIILKETENDADHPAPVFVKYNLLDPDNPAYTQLIALFIDYNDAYIFAQEYARNTTGLHYGSTTIKKR